MKMKSHVIFMCHKNSPLFCLQPFKNVKNFLSLLAVQKQVVMVLGVAMFCPKVFWESLFWNCLQGGNSTSIYNPDLNGGKSSLFPGALALQKDWQTS